MIGYHLAVALFGFRWIFRDPGVDVRFLALGALLPDLVDLPLGTLVLAERYSSGELWSHTLLAPSLVVVFALVFFRHGVWRRRLIAVAVGMFFHLLADGMWTSTATFLWPFAGDFPSGPKPYWGGLVERAVTDPWRWLAEAVGWAYLVTLARQTGLADRARRRLLVTEGRLSG